MKKKQIITIAGTAGSGKSTVAKIVAKIVCWHHYSMGDMQRKTAERKGISLAELGILQERDPTLDREIDQVQESYGREENEFVIDSRLGWYFIPESFKVFLEVDHEIAVERILGSFENEPTRNVEKFKTLEALSEGLKERLTCEQKRYQNYYGIENHHDKKHFHFSLNTAHYTPEEVADKIIEAYEKWISTAE